MQFTLSEAAANGTAFETSDLNITNGTISALAGGPLVYTGTVTVQNQNVDGEVTIFIPQDRFQDSDGNGNQASTYTMNYNEGAPPVVTIVSSPSSMNKDLLSGGSTLLPVVTLLFHSTEQAGNGTLFSIDDVLVVNGTASNQASYGFTGLDWTADITPTSDDTLVSVSVPAGRFQDADGNDNLASDVFTFTRDTTGPTCGTSTPATTNGGGTSVNPVVCTFDWSEPVTGFDVTDIVCGNGTLSNFTQVSSTQWTCDVTATSPGQVSIHISNLAVEDAAGNQNANITGQFIYSYIAPIV
jgi:hypothetical protein